MHLVTAPSITIINIYYKKLHKCCVNHLITDDKYDEFIRPALGFGF